MGGAYAIEELTNEIEQRAVDYLDKIDALGGTLRAIETGYIQREIQNAAYEYQRAVETNDQIVVGVNRFQTEENAKSRRCASILRLSKRKSRGSARSVNSAIHR